MSIESLLTSLPDSAVSLPTDASQAAILQANGDLKIVLDAALAATRQQSNINNDKLLLIGRQAATAHLRIQHDSISRQHALLYYSVSGSDNTRQLVLQDLGSKYGTTVNGERVESKSTTVLNNGDIIMLGNVREHVWKVILPKITKKRKLDDSSIPVQQPSEVINANTEPSEEDVIQQGTKLIEQAGQGLEGRAKRQAEIQAMMASLEDAPKYHRVEATLDDNTDQPIFENKLHQVVDEQEREQNMLAQKYQIPVADSITLDSGETGRKASAVTCIAWDPSGARLAAGGIDTYLKLYDFAGMTLMHRSPFSINIPDDHHGLSSMAYSSSGDKLLVGTASVQPVLMNRDGQEIMQFVRGDMYLTDVSKTKGHTASVTGASWHPYDKSIVVTASMDGSVRKWNVTSGKTQFDKLVCSHVMSIKSERGIRTGATSVAFHPNGRSVAVGTVCGSLQFWKLDAHRATTVIGSVHGPNKAVDCVQFSSNGRLLATRSAQDDTLHVFDTSRELRATKSLQLNGVPSLHDNVNLSWNIAGTLLCAATSHFLDNKKLHEKGSLMLFSIDISRVDLSVDPVMSLNLHTGGLVTYWHPRLNQIAVGLSDGSIQIYYDSGLSEKGALLVAGKAGRKADGLSELLQSRAPQGFDAIVGEIVTPLAQPNNRRNKKNEPEHYDEQAGKPKVGVTTFQQFVADQSIKKSKKVAGEDPREAFMKYKVEKADDRVLADKTVEEEEEEMRAGNR